MLYISYITFAKLYEDANETQNEEMYIAERGWQSWMNDISIEDIAKILKSVYDIAKMNFREMRGVLNISRTEMSRSFSIPLRTLERWESKNDPVCPADHFEMLISYAIFLHMLNETGVSEDE